MIFLLELYVKNRAKKIKQWENDKQKWMNDKEDIYGYRTARMWERQNPYPVINFGKVFASFIPIVGVGFVAAFFITLVVNHEPAPIDPKNPNNCKVVVKKGDKVAVHEGDFTGSKGNVISQNSDCDVTLELTDSTWSVKICKDVDKTYCDTARDNGAILRVNGSNTITKL